MAQVMTRGMVISRFIIQWEIRSQVPYSKTAHHVALRPRWFLSGMLFID